MKTILWIAGILLILGGVFLRLVVASWNPGAIVLTSAGLLLILVFAVMNRKKLNGGAHARHLLYGFNLVVLVIVVLGLIGVINYVSTEYYHRWDLTANKEFTLSKETDKVLGRLRHKLVITAFFQEGTGTAIRELLSEYAYVSKKVHYEVIDPDKEPTIAQGYGITTNGTLVVRYNGKTIKTQQATENGITNAVIRILRHRVITVCYLTGNGERSLTDATGVDGYHDFEQALTDQDYAVEPVLLPSVATVPSSCTLVVEAGAVKRFLPREINALKGYLDAGGNLFVMIDPRTSTGMIHLLASYGITIGNNVVLDQVVRLFQGPGLGVEPLVTDYSKESAITRDFKGTTIFPLVRTVGAAGTHTMGRGIHPLAMTSKTSWADTDLKDLFDKGTAQFGLSDTRGPVSVAVAGTIKPGRSAARIAVFGTSKIAANKYLNALANKDLVMNTISWLVKEENLITIRPKESANQQMFLTAQQGSLIFYLTVVLIPALLFFGALLAYLRMKRL